MNFSYLNTVLLFLLYKKNSKMEEETQSITDVANNAKVDITLDSCLIGHRVSVGEHYGTVRYVGPLLHNKE